MVAVPIPETWTVPQSYQPRRPGSAPAAAPDPARAPHAGPIPVAPPTPAVATSGWGQYVAAGAFLAAGALLATGHRRLGIAAAAAGAATVLLEDSEAVAAFCQHAPAYLADAQSLVSQTEQLLRGCFAAADAMQR